VRLARESGNDAIHAAAPRLAVEGLQVSPDRRRIQDARFHKRDKLGGCKGFPFDVSDGVVFVSKKLECSADALAEHADSGAQVDSGK
jgi:hypothetical protein